MNCWINKEKDRFLWNISGDVGLNSPNKQIDVSFVQFALKVRLSASFFEDTFGDSVELKESIRKMVVGTPCSGRKGDPLVEVIDLWQQDIMHGYTKDGKISTIKDGTYATVVGPQTSLLVKVNNGLRIVHPTQYPRVDLMPNCPLDVKTYVRFVMAGQKNTVLE
jgi:hypothetical protein